MQAKPNCALHWFDPFGSVRFEDLHSRPAINNLNGLARRYLMWDQEPVHTDYVIPWFDQYRRIYDGATTLITSEYESEGVELVCNTYNIQSAYYFFHGWAALDWFRGYDRSFLMLPYRERRIKKTFIMPNRIVAGERKHRLAMLYHIFKSGIADNHISCPAVCPAENIGVVQAAAALNKRYPDISEVFAQESFPKEFVGESNAPMHSYQLSLFNESAESLLYLVTETVATGRRQHLTEKTFKPIALKMPFVIVGCAGSLRYLKKYGFRTFDHLWDESYDNEINDDQRYEKISWLLRSLDALPVAERQHLFDLAEEVCEHNFRHFYSGGFEQILWQELEGMLECLTL